MLAPIGANLTFLPGKKDMILLITEDDVIQNINNKIINDKIKFNPISNDRVILKNN